MTLRFQPHLFSRCAPLPLARMLRRVTALRPSAQTLVIELTILLCMLCKIYPQNDLTRIYGTEDRGVPTPSCFTGAIGQQDAAAVQEIENYRTIVNAAEWKGLQANGTLTDSSGNSNQATLLILGGDHYRLDYTTSAGKRSIRLSGAFGFSQGENGKTHNVPPVTARGGLIAFPRLLVSPFPDPTMTIVDRGTVQIDGSPFHRITIESRAFPSLTAHAVPNRDFNITDLYFDPATHLLIKSASSVQISSADRERYLIIVTYGDYQTVGSVLVPLNLVQTMNGQRQWVLQLSSPNLQPTVDSSYFHF